MKYLQIGMVVWLMQFPALSAQDLSFFHLDKSDGLSDNTITSVVSDTSGLIWVATLNGLNSYDGYTVRNFYVRDYPSLQSNIISRLVCDTKNRIWIQAVDGRLSVLDEKRQFHAINLKEVSVDYLLPVSDMPMFLSSGRMYGLAHDGSLNFIPLVTSHEALLKIKFERINPWDTDKLVFTGEGQLFLFDFRTLRVSASVRIPGVLAASRLSADTAMVTTHDSQKLLKVNIRNGEIIKSYGTIKDQYGTLMDANPGSIQSLNDRRFLIASPKSGVYTFDVDHETLIRYSHDPLDDRSM
ncbi:MAG TPA: two-component regulator propeller domain-containing protein, partial [Saprospiraceae bacterium]